MSEVVCLCVRQHNNGERNIAMHLDLTVHERSSKAFLSQYLSFLLRPI